MRDPIIGDHPHDGKDYDAHCARCGSSVEWHNCSDCDGTGNRDADDDFSNDECEVCDGKGGWWACTSSAEWCQQFPMPGREEMVRDEIEWIEVKR